jgi:hypothetical protein
MQFKDDVHGQHDGEYRRLDDGNGWKVYWVASGCHRYPEGCVPQRFGNVVSHGSVNHYKDGGAVPYSMLYSMLAGL